MKRSLFLLVLMLAVYPASMGAQNKVSKPFSVTVGGNVVTLNWNASISPNIASYNIFRSTVSGGPYTKIDSSTTLSYTDLKALPHTTYFYVVTAVNSSGQESANSNEATAVIP